MSEEQPIKSSAQRVQRVLMSFGLATNVQEMPATTRSAKEAAHAIGCAVDQIAKSLVFRMKNSGRPLLVIASGKNRVNESKMAELVGEPIERATPDFVRETTGYAIGGVPPVGHEHPLPVWVDQDLLSFDVIWAAAGTPQAVFKITPQELLRVTGAQVVTL